MYSEFLLSSRYIVKAQLARLRLIVSLIFLKVEVKDLGFFITENLASLGVCNLFRSLRTDVEQTFLSAYKMYVVLFLNMTLVFLVLQK